MKDHGTWHVAYTHKCNCQYRNPNPSIYYRVCALINYTRDHDPASNAKPSNPPARASTMAATDAVVFREEPVRALKPDDWHGTGGRAQGLRFRARARVRACSALGACRKHDLGRSALRGR